MTTPHDHRVLTAILAARHESDLQPLIHSVIEGLTPDELGVELMCTIGGLVGVINALAELLPGAEEAIDEMNRMSALERNTLER